MAQSAKDAATVRGDVVKLRPRQPARRRRRSGIRVAKALVTAGLLFGAGLVGYSELGDQVRVVDGDTPRVDGVRVVDGDTIRVDGKRVRLWGFDAPERQQTCMVDGRSRAIGEEATESLTAILARGELRCATRDTDRYGRTVAECWVNQQSIGDAMVRSGWAWALPRFSGNTYLPAQEEAERAGRGVWAGHANCKAPAQFRQEHQ